MTSDHLECFFSFAKDDIFSLEVYRSLFEHKGPSHI